MTIRSISTQAFMTKTGTIAVIGLASTVMGWLTVWDVKQSVSGGGLLPLPIVIVFPIALILFLLPNWLLLVLCVPLLVMISNTFSIPPLLKVGDAHIQIYDLFIIVVSLKVLTFAAVHKQRIEIYPSITIFLMVLLGTTFLGYHQFGSDAFKSEAIALSRFIAQVSTFFLFIHSVRTTRQLELSYKFIGFFGYIAAASVLLNIALFPFGITFGEVQATRSIKRFYGPLGDQVAFFLLFFIYKEFMARKTLRAVFFGSALLATGVRGALISFGVGLIVLLIYLRRERLQHHTYWIPLSILIGIISFFFYFDLGGTLTRSQSIGINDDTIGQRLLLMMHAVQVFLDHILVGVGFTGFRFAVQNYSGPVVLLGTTSNQYLQVATDAGILGLGAFLWMVKNVLQTLKAALTLATDELRNFLISGYAWLLALLIGNQSAAWILPESMISYLLWLILGIAVVTIDMRQSAVPTNAEEAAYATLTARS